MKELTIDGMTCKHCVAAVAQAIESVPGVRRESVGLGHATVDAGDEDVDRVRQAIEAEGYRVTSVKQQG